MHRCAIARLAAVVVLLTMAPSVRPSGPNAGAATRLAPGRLEPAGADASLMAAFAAARAPVTVDPQIYSETKLTGSDVVPGGFNDFFGASVSISGDSAVIGAFGHPHESLGLIGSAYVFVRSGSGWTEQAELIASDPAQQDFFGISVAISGDTIVVGAPLDDDAGDSSGSAYVFVRSGSSWTEQAKLTGSDTAGGVPGNSGDEFGMSVAITGDTVVVGARSHIHGLPAQGNGAAYVFERSGSVWAQQAELIPSEVTAYFGSSVAIDGDTLVVGAVYNNLVFVFERSGSSWAAQPALTGSDAEFGDDFGAFVAISGDTVVVGAPSNDALGEDSGSAYVFVRSGSSWTQLPKLTAPDTAAGDEFGGSVAVSGDTVVVGAPFNDASGIPAGSAYVFLRSGFTCTQQAQLTASDAGGAFGESVAISGGMALVGASNKAYVFLNVTEADLQLGLGADKTTVRPGDLLTYTITARNLGPNGALNPVVIDSLPSGTKFVSASANRGAVTAPQPGQAGTVTWSPGTLVNGDGDAQLQMRVRVISRGSTAITNTATVSSESFDPNPDNNSASLTTDVVRGSGK
jgi:uncharacterized repeat protein (TIGR01451 family)